MIFLGCAAFGSSGVRDRREVRDQPAVLTTDNGGRHSVQTALIAAIEPVAHRVT